MVNKPDLNERGLKCFYYHPYLIPAEFPQDNSRGNIGIKKMVPKQHAKYFKR
jgi:hypothetical protein